MLGNSLLQCSRWSSNDGPDSDAVTLLAHGSCQQIEGDACNAPLLREKGALSQNNRMSVLIRIQRRFLEAKSIEFIYFTFPEEINSCSLYLPRKLSQKRPRNSAHINDHASPPEIKISCALICCHDKTPFRNHSKVSYLRQQEQKSQRSVPARRGSRGRGHVPGEHTALQTLGSSRSRSPCAQPSCKHPAGGTVCWVAGVRGAAADG